MVMKTAYSPGRPLKGKPTNFFSLIMWGIFGNADDTTAPPTYMPGSSLWWRKICWWMRNPFHNLCFYVIGTADKPVVAIGKDPTCPFVTSGWNYTVIKYKWLRLPFISYQGTVIRAYLGWRPPEGSFGIKCMHVKSQ